ncbi:uncharacterized protein LOC141597005 [Silene latifolia]|uniref:uncharacterized protein LOC141597005 n=1 Tax=Silene latifolia TaxID=37657 RepID=UPI003D77328B
MDMVSEETSTICAHCNRPIPSTNIDLHFVHCSRNLEKCKVCGDMVPRNTIEDHYINTHAPVACSLCSETMERGILDVHKGESCPQRIATCEFCEFPLPAIDMIEHQDVCGNRTELCNHCGKYIRLREIYVHQTMCNGATEGVAGSSRVRRPAPERRARAEGRVGSTFSHKHVLVSIAITGVALILGSLIFQKKPDSNPSQ